MTSALRLFSAMLKVGTIGFGGGSAVIPVMERELVQRRKILDERTFVSHTVVANITPGALPVKLGALAGAHTGTALASVLGAVASALPGAIGTVGLLALFAAVGESAIRVVEFAAVGITVFIIMLLATYVTRIITRARSRRIAASVMVAAFLTTGANQLITLAGVLIGASWEPNLPRLSAVGLVLIALFLIAVLSFFWSPPGADPTGTSRTAGKNLVSALIFVALAAMALILGVIAGSGRFMGLVGLSTVSSFGGGEAYVGVADGFFVASGYVDSQQFYGQIVPVANAMPGPILIKVASALGYFFGLQQGSGAMGVLMAVLVFVLTVATCSALAMLVMAGYDKASKSIFVRNLGLHILPVICGLLATTSVSMVLANVEIGRNAGMVPPAVAWASLGGVGLLWWLHRRFTLHDLVLLGLGGATSLTVLLVLS